MNKDKRNNIQLLGTLNNADESGIIANANQIYDANEDKSTQDVSKEHTERIKTLEDKENELIAAVGTGGSVDTRITNAVTAEQTRAEGVESTLDGKITAEQTRAANAENALDGRVDTLEEAVGTGGSVDSRITSAVATETSRAQKAEANRYTKNEIYTKEEVNNLITTPNQEYVSVTATDQTTAVTDVLPAIGLADTVYRVGNWDGTQYNDSVFSEYAWNGSAYIKLSTKSQVGEVYDISANHADTKYADLAAALGANGKNIPQSLRKGGMSVKFVQSSDNTYVQYRLKNQDFTINTAYWERYNDVITDNGPDDFSIRDEAGNILCLWKDGHIKTKNFDSNSVGGKIKSDSNHIKFKRTDGKGYEQHEYIKKSTPILSFVTPLKYCNSSDTVASYTPTVNKFAAAMIEITSQDIVTIPYLMGIALDATDTAYSTQRTDDYPVTLGLYDESQKLLIGVLDKTTTAQTNKVIDFRKELTLVKSSTTSTYTLTAGSTYYLYIQTQANPSSVTDSSTTDDYVNACKNQINAIIIESHVLKDIKTIDANSVDIVDSDNPFDFDIEDENQNILVGLKDGHIKTKNFDSKETLQIINGLKNNSIKTLEGKKGVWLGTSIPAQGYPDIVGKILGMTIHNEAVGASSCRKGNQNYSDDPLSDNYLGLYSVAWQNYFFGLSASQEEKFYIMKCWSANGRKEVLKNTINSETGKKYTDSEVSSVKGFRSLMAGNFFGNLTDPDAGDSNDEPTDWFIEKFAGTKNYALSCSYNTSSVSGVLIEGKIEKYLKEDKFPDIWFFDHSHNDSFGESPESMSKIPTDFYDRNYYIGACNFIFNLILSYKSTAKIILIGHYTKGEKGTNNPLSCYSAMKKLQDIWQFPLIENYKNLPFSSDSIIQTNGYWDASNVWHEKGFELEQDTSVDLGSSTQQKINGFWYYKINNVVYKSNNQAIAFYNPILSPILYKGKWYQQISLKQRYFSDDLHPSSEKTKELYGKILANEIIKEFLISTFYE